MLLIKGLEKLRDELSEREENGENFERDFITEINELLDEFEGKMFFYKKELDEKGNALMKEVKSLTKKASK
mgnify:CR=1 FL=1